jgi:hypothetical protein
VPVQFIYQSRSLSDSLWATNANFKAIISHLAFCFTIATPRLFIQHSKFAKKATKNCDLP